MKIVVTHDFYFDPQNPARRIQRGWWVNYYGGDGIACAEDEKLTPGYVHQGDSACCWLVPSTLALDEETNK